MMLRTLMLGGLLLGACTQTAPKKEDAPKKEETKPEREAKTPELKAEKEEPTAGLTGVPECDRYIKSYSKCIEAKAPQATKAAMHDALAKSVETWKKAAAGPARDAIAEACKTAYESAAKTATAWGCEF